MSTSLHAVTGNNASVITSTTGPLAAATMSHTVTDGHTKISI